MYEHIHFLLIGPTLGMKSWLQICYRGDLFFLVSTCTI